MLRHLNSKTRLKKRASEISFRTSVICSSFSSKGLPSLLLKKVATPTISSFLLTMGRERTFLTFHPVSSTASFCQMNQIEYPDYFSVRLWGKKTNKTKQSELNFMWVVNEECLTWNEKYSSAVTFIMLQIWKRKSVSLEISESMTLTI